MPACVAVLEMGGDALCRTGVQGSSVGLLILGGISASLAAKYAECVSGFYRSILR